MRTYRTKQPDATYRATLALAYNGHSFFNRKPDYKGADFPSPEAALHSLLSALLLSQQFLIDAELLATFGKVLGLLESCEPCPISVVGGRHCAGGVGYLVSVKLGVWSDFEAPQRQQPADELADNW